MLAQAAIGQYDVRSTPLQMALLVAGVANAGEIMAPHVVDRVVDGDDDQMLEQVEPMLWRRAVGPDVARVSADLMEGVVERGTATALRRPGLVIGAKTGTAEVDAAGVTDDTHAWIIAYAGLPDGPADLAIAVVVEAVPGAGQQTGSEFAAPIAAAVIDAHYG